MHPHSPTRKHARTHTTHTQHTRTHTQAFSSLAAPALRQGAARRTSCRGGVQALRAEDREDGASEAQIKDAYKTYDMLMGNKNFGKGYWMDEKPFFTNIAQAFERNFGSSKNQVDMDDAVEDQPAGSVNLGKSLFKPLVPVGERRPTISRPCCQHIHG